MATILHLPIRSTVPSQRDGSCPHLPTCPSYNSPNRDSAVTIAPHPEQGWWLLCNGVVVFADTGELLPDGTVIAPHRPEGPHHA